MGKLYQPRLRSCCVPEPSGDGTWVSSVVPSGGFNSYSYSYRRFPSHASFPLPHVEDFHPGCVLSSFPTSPSLEYLCVH